MADIDNPLTDDDLKELKSNLKDLDRVDKLIAQSERAGFDMTAQKAQAAEQRKKLTQIKQSFFGNR
ncbi:MAG: hypothetical protein A2V70_19465 [Planctomycetes bacterium RBG_13_63_9]|nr:MAG: hypothetical protein A2V70_19465 [Planctomycetes bacterium RBG_13_63_9]